MLNLFAVFLIFMFTVSATSCPLRNNIGFILFLPFISSTWLIYCISHLQPSTHLNPRLYFMGDNTKSDWSSWMATSDVTLAWPWCFFMSPPAGRYVLLRYGAVWAAVWAETGTGTAPAPDSKETLQRCTASAGQSRGSSVLLPPQLADWMLGHQAWEGQSPNQKHQGLPVLQEMHESSPPQSHRVISSSQVTWCKWTTGSSTLYIISMTHCKTCIYSCLSSRFRCECTQDGFRIHLRFGDLPQSH